MELNEALKELEKAGFICEGSLKDKIAAKLFNRQEPGKIKTIADLINYAMSLGFGGKIYNKNNGYIEFSEDSRDTLFISTGGQYANEGGWEVYWDGSTGEGFDTVDEVVAYVKPIIAKWLDRK